MKTFKRYLILTHRYVGIPLSLVFVTWFLSGIVMLYTGGMPSLSETDRLVRMTDLNLAQVQVSPTEAMAVVGRESGGYPELRMLHDRPLYQFSNSSMVGVFADTGEILRTGGINSQRLTAEFLGVDESLITREAMLEDSDQWTLGLRGSLPLHKYRVADGEGSQVYVSSQRAEVVLHTTRADRLLAWAGAIPHWYYLESLRENPRAWARAVVWTATLGCLFTVLGLILLFTQWRRVRPFSLKKAIPYRGLHRWHYILGGLFGLVTLTWTFSGLLSMEPYEWTNAQGYRIPLNIFDGSTTRSAAFDRVVASESAPLGLQATPPGLKKVRFTSVLGQPYLELVALARDASSRTTVTESLVHATSLDDRPVQNDIAELEAIVSNALQSAGDGVEIDESELLTEYDSFYYPRNGYGGISLPLPVLRLKLNDADRTWYYIDLNSVQFVYQNHRLSRLERWLYNGLHSLDFSFWYQIRPLWDVVMISLLLGGMALSGLGGYLGVRRLLGR